MVEKRPVRPLVWVLGGTLGLVGITVGVLFALVRAEAARWPSLAETPQVTSRSVPARDDGQAWQRINAACESLPEELPDFSAILEREGIPSADVLSTAAPFRAHIDSLRAAVTSTEGLSVPLPASWDDPGPQFLPVIRLSWAWLLFAWSSAAAGDPALGLTEMLHVQALGARLTAGDAGLIGTMMGIVIHQKARREILELLAAFGVTQPDLYAQAAAGLVPIEPGGVARGLVGEARMMEAMMAEQRDSMPTLEAWGYDDDTTRVWIRLQMKPQVDRAETPRWERVPVEPLPLWSDDGGVVQQLHNRTGRILLSLGMADFGRFVDREDGAVAASRLDILAVAARRFALDHGGALPADQGQLVPTYLPTPLLDPYDGQPLRLEGGSAWSVGEAEAPDGVTLRRAL